LDIALSESLSALIRWLHVIAGIAWIGTSFYFIHLDLSLKKGASVPSGIKGEAWQVHSGGFYQMVKYVVAPARLPESMTWFKWEAYATWLTGFALLIVVYYFGADLFLIDKAVLDISAPVGAGIAFGSLVLLWLFYEGLCRSPLGRHDVALAIIGYVFLVTVTYGFTHVFSGRGALTQIGALIGTIMVANVFLVIIPNQKKVVADLVAGRTPDPALGDQSKQRSVHNNYLTLPVVFLMLSNHYPLIYATRYNWLIVAVVLAIGPAIRHYYNVRHEGKKREPLWPWAVAAWGILLIVWLMLNGSPWIKTGAAASPSSFKAVQEIVRSRCSMCHANEPVWAGITAPPHDVRLDTAAEIRRHGRLIEIWAVLSRAMPPGNITGMTDSERKTLASWRTSAAPPLLRCPWYLCGSNNP
jgi:uncharacterized membrane protein